MASFKVTGSFTGTGASASVQGKKVAVNLTFAGTATVDVEWQLDGTNWVAFDDGNFTATGQKIYEGPSVPIRVNCTAHTNDVTYTLISYS